MANTEETAEERHRTTLYLPADLATALKRLALERRRPVNVLIVEAVQALVSAHQTDGETKVPAADGTSLDANLALRRDLDRLGERVAVLEAHIHGRSTVADARGARRILTATEVRHEARALIEARGAPIPHRELLFILQERYVLPGRNPSENLRTILVHPKARGFVFVHGKGYSIL